VRSALLAQIRPGHSIAADSARFSSAHSAPSPPTTGRAINGRCRWTTRFSRWWSLANNPSPCPWGELLRG